MKIRVHTNAEFLRKVNEDKIPRFLFHYNIRIINDSEAEVQLLSRYWRIAHGNAKIEEVEGEGVVGQQPVIGPGDEFEYQSGAALDCEVGTMQGHYVMQRADGTKFEVEIPPFVLSIPRTLH